MTIPSDITDHVNEVFGDQRVAVHDILATLACDIPMELHRVLRAVVFLAGDDLSRLNHYAIQAVADYRDVLYWAEYDSDDKRVYDFSQPFGGPQDAS